MADNVDDVNARRYLDNLQEQVGRGEITLAEYERLSSIIAGNLTGGSSPVGGEVAVPETGKEVASTKGSGKSLSRKSFDGMLALWAGVVSLNVVIWGIVSFSVDSLYFWPVWVALPGVLLAVWWIAAGFGKEGKS